MMNKQELKAVLLHERYHLKNKDSVIMLLASLLKLLFPFFPVVSDLLTQYKINREIEADKETIRVLGNSLPIISVLKKLLAFPSPTFANATAIADYVTLEPRIKALLKQNNNSRKVKVSNMIISFLSIVLLGAFVITPVHAVAMHMPKQDAMMLCLQDDACATWCKEHNTVVPYSGNYHHAANASYGFTPTK